MRVQVKLFATLRENRFATKRIDLPEPATIADLLDSLDIPQGQAGIILLNGTNVYPDHKLSDKDSISIFPALGGG